MSLEKIKKVVFLKRLKTPIFCFLLTIFGVCFFVFGNIKIALAVDGIMNGKTITGETDNYLFWLQTYDPTTAPYFFDRLFVNKTGNVGIGTTSPAAKLEVVDASNSWSIMAGGRRISHVNLPQYSDDAATRGYVDANFVTPTGVSSSSLWGGIKNGDIWNGDAGLGNVGIGTNAPADLLDVSGNNAAATIYPIITRNITNTSGSGGNVGIKFALSSGGGQEANKWTSIESFDTSNWGSNGGLSFTTNNGYTKTKSMVIDHLGNVGIGTTNPATTLEVVSPNNASILAGGKIIGNVNLPAISTDVATKGYVDSNSAPITGGSYLPLIGGTMLGDINMGGHKITALDIATIGTLNVTKITAVTIDPLYYLNGINYATFVSSISGGVKEEYVGKIKINEYNSKMKAFEAIIDFNNVKEGSDLWVWHKVVDFNSENVDAAITPYNGFANVYYLIDGDKLIFRSNKSITVSYRLIGKRFDWRNWPTKALDQTIKGVEIK